MLMDFRVGFYLQDTTILLFAGSFWYLRLKSDFVKAGHGHYQKGSVNQHMPFLYYSWHLRGFL